VFNRCELTSRPTRQPKTSARPWRENARIWLLQNWRSGRTPDCGRYVSGEYRFETLHGSHWMLDEQPNAVADLLLEWLGAHPI
jgi:hypothetical protein